MSDDVMKRAREWLRESSLRGRPTRPELTLLEVDALLAHLDGEPARQAEAVAKAREEQREACALAFQEQTSPVLAATPLADENAALARARDLYAQTLHEESVQWSNEIAALKARVAELEEQVASATEGLDRIASWGEGPEVTGAFDEPGSAQVARNTLAEMKETGSQPTQAEVENGIQALKEKCAKLEGRVDALRSTLADAERLVLANRIRAEKAEARAKALEAERDEAVAALRGLEDACASVASWSEECLDFRDPARERTRAVLAKHPEGK